MNPETKEATEVSLGGSSPGGCRRGLWERSPPTQVLDAVIGQANDHGLASAFRSRPESPESPESCENSGTHSAPVSGTNSKCGGLVCQASSSLDRLQALVRFSGMRGSTLICLLAPLLVAAENAPPWDLDEVPDPKPWEWREVSFGAIAKPARNTWVL